MLEYDDRGRRILHLSFEGVVTRIVYDQPCETGRSGAGAQGDSRNIDARRSVTTVKKNVPPGTNARMQLGNTAE